jgi:hypothetical protein
MHDNTSHVSVIASGKAEFRVQRDRRPVTRGRGSGIEDGVSHYLTRSGVITLPKVPASVEGYVGNACTSSTERAASHDIATAWLQGYKR